MTSAVVAFAFGVPNTLPGNRAIAAAASAKARSIGGPVYTQQDVLPLDDQVEAVQVAEHHPDRVPTLRIARGAVRWAKDRRLSELWVCAAPPHRARAMRDLRFACAEACAPISLKLCDGLETHQPGFWFSPQSSQPDTRLRWLWWMRDSVLLSMPMRLYARIAS
jgi:hypothetical protein